MPHTRRAFLSLTAAGLAAPAFAAQTSSGITAYTFAFDGLEGGAIALGAYAGKPLLVVNTASLCGFTPQYTGLQALYARYKDQGLTIIGVPSNDFGGQEPGEAADIAHVSHDSFGVTFPLAAKTIVRGPNAHRFYKWAAQERPGELPGWNFHKYLIGRDGKIAAVFPTGVAPADPALVATLERALDAAG
jgi:glutathione peroxidase